MKTREFQELVAEIDPDLCPLIEVWIAGTCGEKTAEIVGVVKEIPYGKAVVEIVPD